MKSYLSFFLVVSFGVMLGFLGCSGSRQAVERTNVGNGGNDVVARFKREGTRLLRQIEQSYPATEFAKEKGVDLHVWKNAFNHPALVIASVDQVLHDRNGNPVHARVIGNRLELEEDFWREQFDSDLVPEDLLVHELLRLYPALPTSPLDEDYRFAQRLVDLKSNTLLIAPELTVPQVTGEGCSAQEVKVAYDLHSKRLSLNLIYPLPVSFVAKNISGAFSQLSGTTSCELRITLPVNEAPRLSHLEATSYVRAVSGERGQIEIRVRSAEGNQQTFTQLVDTTQAGPVYSLPDSFVENRAISAALSERNVIVVRVEGRSFSSKATRLETESLQIYFL